MGRDRVDDQVSNQDQSVQQTSHVTEPIEHGVRLPVDDKLVCTEVDLDRREFVTT